MSPNHVRILGDGAAVGAVQLCRSGSSYCGVSCFGNTHPHCTSTDAWGRTAITA